jgi:hypothetical protein
LGVGRLGIEERLCQVLPGLKPLNYTEETRRKSWLGVACDNERHGKHKDSARFG